MKQFFFSTIFWWILILSVCSCPNDVSAQVRVDSLFYLSGKVEVVTIVRNSSEAIECNYLGEDFLTVISKDKLQKIVFRSGRVEVCNEKNSEKFDTIVFSDGNTLKGKVIRLSEDSVEYCKEHEKDITYTMPRNFIKEIVYANGKVEKLGTGSAVDEVLALFNNGKIKTFPDEQQEKYSDVLEDSIKEELKRVETQEELDAVMAKYDTFIKYIGSVRSRWGIRAIWRINPYIDRAEKKIQVNNVASEGQKQSRNEVTL
ncbi:MAG: hypothetical protein IKP46_01465 [Bacteroidales bacterium]|nr:hypothetical protein [Bacteroidales bacterium]